MLTAAFSSTGSLATGDYDGNVYIWDLRTASIVKKFSLPGSSCRQDLCAAISALRFSRSGKVLAAGNESGRAELWDVTGQSGEPVGLPTAAAGQSIWGLSFGNSGLLAIADSNGYSYLYTSMRQA